MDLAAVGQMSIDMHMAQTQEAVGVAVTKKAMDVQETQATALIQMMQRQPTSYGRTLDQYI